MKKQSLSSLLKVLLFLSLGIILVVWKYRGLSSDNKEAMFDSFKHIRWIWMIPIVIIGFFSHFFRALRWKQILEPIDIRPSTTNITLAVLIGYLGNTIIPRFGEIAKCTILAKYENVSVDKLVGTIIAERAFDVVTLLLVFAITLGVEFNTILPFANNLKNDLSTFSIWKIILILAAIIAFFILLIKWILPKIKSSKIGGFIINIGMGLKSIFQIKKPITFIINSLMIWVCYTSMAYIGFLAIPGLEGMGIMAALAVIAFGSIAMIITPGGIGAYPVIVSQLLILYGVQEGLGMAYGWVSWGAQTIVVILLGLSALVLLPIVNKKRLLNGKMEKDTTENC